ncbi:MAG: glycosyltransferase family 2 protein [Bacteroidota bacterium]
MIFFLIPLFNEAPNIRELSARLSSLRVDDEYHVVLVNDCSTDDTVKMIEKYFQHLKHSLLTNPQNSGPGFSFNKGFEFILSASQNETDLVVTMEGDNTSDFTIFPQMYALAHQWNYDLVLSSVLCPGRWI